MKGIILAGGSGTRLYPMTLGVSKQLMPIYDKPMIYYPLSLLLLGGVREILVISTPRDLPMFQELLGDGSDFGIRFEFHAQAKPEGLAQAFTIGADFIGDDSVCLVLGDNLLHGTGLGQLMESCATLEQGARIFGYQVEQPQAYGVVEFDDSGRVIGLEEKPSQPRSNFAVPGVYFYDSSVVEIAHGLKPSPRGEYEITDVNLHYLERGDLHVTLLGRGYAWLDTGTPDQLMHAAQYVHAVQQRQGLQIACPEEIAFQKGFITREQLHVLAQRCKKTGYGSYLERLAEDQGEADRAFRALTPQR